MLKFRYLAAAATIAVLSLTNSGQNVAHAAFLSYQVIVDTSAVSGQDGNLDFQFNPGGFGAETSSITVTNFQSNGILSQPAILTGDASGSLPGTLTLDNGSAYNDVFQGFNYGNGFSFLLTLSGQAIDSPGGTFGSSFALSLYDAAGITPLLTTDPNGSVLTVTLNPSGTTSTETFPQSPTNNMPVASAISPVPEPSSMMLMAVAFPFAALLIVRRRCLRSINIVH